MLTEAFNGVKEKDERKQVDQPQVVPDVREHDRPQHVHEAPVAESLALPSHLLLRRAL